MFTVADPSLDAQFVAFDGANPRVFIEFKKLAEQMLSAQIAKGKKPRIGARAVWERLRWEVEIDTVNTYGDSFKMNDHMVSRYARKLAASDSRFATAFEFRKLKTPQFQLVG